MEKKLLVILFIIACCVIIFKYKQQIIDKINTTDKDTVIRVTSSIAMLIFAFGFFLYYLKSTYNSSLYIDWWDNNLYYR